MKIERSSVIVGWLTKAEGVDYYDRDTDFNPPLRCYLMQTEFVVKVNYADNKKCGHEDSSINSVW